MSPLRFCLTIHLCAQNCCEFTTHSKFGIKGSNHNREENMGFLIDILQSVHWTNVGWWWGPRGETCTLWRSLVMYREREIDRWTWNLLQKSGTEGNGKKLNNPSTKSPLFFLAKLHLCYSSSCCIGPPLCQNSISFFRWCFSICFLFHNSVFIEAFPNTLTFQPFSFSPPPLLLLLLSLLWLPTPTDIFSIWLSGSVFFLSFWSVWVEIPWRRKIQGEKEEIINWVFWVFLGCSVLFHIQPFLTLWTIAAWFVKIEFLISEF